MSPWLCLSVRFIQPVPLFHGRSEADEPEWPPSPMRLFQALLNAAALRSRGAPLSPELRESLLALEQLQPHIVAPRASLSSVGYRAYVPHNQFDLVFAALARGIEEFSDHVSNLNGQVNTAKDYLPYCIEKSDDELPALHYLYPLNSTKSDPRELLSAIRPVVRSIHHLGWGVDQVIADASLIAHDGPKSGEHWRPSSGGGKRLRVPREGSLDALSARYDKFIHRLDYRQWSPVPALKAFDRVCYRRDDDPLPRPHIIFRLVDSEGNSVAYSQSKLIHIAGMVRHVAIALAMQNPPQDLRGHSVDEWLRSYVAGHQLEQAPEDKMRMGQLSFVPLPSVGTGNADSEVRRVMVIAPLGDEEWLEHLANQLDGELLKPLPNTTLPPGTRLERIAPRATDPVREAYTGNETDWASVTPVILPGHGDHKSNKTRKLIEKSIRQSGISQNCDFSWDLYSQFRNSLPALKFDNRNRRTGYIRPDHLSDFTTVHLRLKFAFPIPGPLIIGAGRHCGFGLMAAARDSPTA